ncbi:MAG: LysM peptidoglycan-binding domain-containing protein [Anaerolineales bacterium]|nr:MAG: LysM peptidoglycan-binding domain-containing protein [Anaerolineales bacterium]
MKAPSRLPWLSAVLAVGALCVVVMAALAALGAFRRSAAVDPNRLRVAIRLPSSGSRVSVADSVIVLLQASGPEAVARYELWVDGARERVVLPEPDEDRLPSTIQVSWRPLEAGPRILIARAFDGDGHIARSRPVVLETDLPARGDRVALDVVFQPGDTLESVADTFGLAPDDLLTANPGWSGDVEEGQEIRVPIPVSQLPAGYANDDGAVRSEPEVAVDQPAPEPAAGLPSRPGSPTATPGDACRVSLEWTQSERADRYEIYRYGGGELDFTSIGQTDARDASFEDSVPLAGAYQYLVAALNAQGSVEGDPAAIDVPAELCPESAPLPEDGMAWLDLELLSFSADPGLDRAYCYAALLPGTAYIRIPAGDDEFLTPQNGMWDIGRFAAGIHRLGFFQRAEHPVRLQLECWGWQGGDLARLGSLDLEHPRTEWDGRDLLADAGRFAALYRLRSHDNQLPQLAPVIFESGPPPPERFRRPENVEECLQGHTNLTNFADAQARSEAWAGVLACATVDNHQMAVWEWTERASPRYLRSELTGFRLYYDRLGREPRDIPRSDWQLFGEINSATQVYPILDPSCGQTYSYWSVAVGHPVGGLPAPEPGEQGPGFRPPIPGPELPIRETFESPPSNALSASGRDCPEIQEVLLDITLDSIRVGHTWDSCFDIDFECEDGSLETYGQGTFFRIHADGSTEETAEVVFWGDFADCGMNACLGYGWVPDHHTIYLSEEYMSVCDVEGCRRLNTDNNHIRVWVGDGEDIGFEFTLWDQDDDSGRDIWCGTTDDADYWGGADKDANNDTKAFHVGGARTAENWSHFDQRAGDWNNNGLNHQDAVCTVSIIVSAVEVAR